MIAEVIVDANVDKILDYEIPSEYTDILELGMRVVVPLLSRKVLGFVVKIKEYSDVELEKITFEIKKIIEVLDIIPSLNSELLFIADEIYKKNNALKISVFKMMLPSLLFLKYNSYLIKINSNETKLDYLFANENNKVLLTKKIKEENAYIIKKEILNKNIEIDYSFISKENILKEKYIRLLDNDYSILKLSLAQIRLVNYLKQNNPSLKNMLPPISKDKLQDLKNMNIVEEFEAEKYRDIKSLFTPINKTVNLTSKQENIVDEILGNPDYTKPYLLHGVTGSGKTEVYIKIVKEVLSENKTSLILVPEISLIPQILERFKSSFLNTTIAIFHSGLSPNLQYDEYRRVLRNEAKIIIGVRSSIFLPIQDLGIIIIDEEHDQSYIQTDPPYYNTVSIAKLRSNYHKAKLLLGSATPSVISYYKAKNNIYNLLELNERANNAQLPNMYLVNMKEEFRQGNRSIISKYLKELIEDRLNKKEQIIILLNKKGYSSFMLCPSCGYSPKCPNCDVSLTHKDSMLECRYCGYKTKILSTCPKCNSIHIKDVGIGTEKVEKKLNELFPQSKVIRMDQDTTQKKGSHEEILFSFYNKEYDILLGTQMISKGLNFPNVTLVGILMADLYLKIPDYKSSEKTFQLVTQVSGRAGRFDKNGEVVVQTYNDAHYSILYSIRNSFNDFYTHELGTRKLANYPPFTNMMEILISHEDLITLYKEANKLEKELSKFDLKIYGPTTPYIPRLNNRNRLQMLIKYNDPKLLQTVLDIISEYNQILRIDIDNTIL